MVRDILDALVAAGTLALAGVTGWLAFTTRGSVRESYRARIAASSQHVLVKSFAVDKQPRGERRADASTKDPPFLTPGTEWALDSNGWQKLGLFAVAVVHNEGTTTALVSVECPEDVENLTMSAPFWEASEPSNALGIGRRLGFFGVQNGEWYVLPPGESLPVHLIWWRREPEWVASAQRGSDPPTVSVKLIFRDATGLAEDRCQLTFGSYVLWPYAVTADQPGNEKWHIALRSGPTPVPSQPPPPIEKIGSLVRSWPGE